MKSEHPDLDNTDPNFKPLSPDQTQRIHPPRIHPPRIHSPVEGDPELNPILDPVIKDDNTFKRTVQRALLNRFAGKKVSILDFERVEEKDGEDEFRFTVKIGGEERKILVEKRKEQASQ
jgi:hypothetical protein